MFSGQDSKHQDSQYIPQYAVSFVKSSETYSYKSSLDQQYQQLKMKLKSVEDKNKAALKKIKQNMLQYTRQEEDMVQNSMDYYYKPQSMASLQRTVLFSDYNEDQISSQTYGEEQQISKQVNSRYRMGYTPFKSTPKQNFNYNIIELNIEEFQKGMKKKMNVIINNLWKIENKVEGVSSYMKGVRNKIRIKKQLDLENHQINQVLKKQRKFLIDEYQKKLSQRIKQNEELQKNVNKFKTISEQKNYEMGLALKKIEKLEQANRNLQELLKDSVLASKKTINELMHEQSQLTIQTQKKYHEFIKSYSSQKLINEQNRECKQVQNLANIITSKEKQISALKQKLQNKQNRMKQMADLIGCKNQQIQKLENQLKNILSHEIKTKSLQKELQQKCLNLEKQLISFHQQSNQKIKKLTNSHKKKINELIEKQNMVRQFIAESSKKIIKGPRKESFYQQINKKISIKQQLNIIFSILLKKQQQILRFFSETCDIAPHLIEHQGITNILNSLNQTIKQKDKRISQLQKLQTIYEDKICKIKRQSSPIFKKHLSMKLLENSPIIKKKYKQEYNKAQSATKKIILLESKEIEQENEKLRIRIQNLNESISHLETNEKKMKAKIKELQQQKNHIQQQLQSKNSKMDQNINDKINESRRFFEQQLRKLNDRNINLNKQNNLLKKNYLEMEARKNEELCQKQNKNYTISAQFKLLQASLKQKHQQIQQIRNQNISLKEQVQKLQVTITQLQITIQQLKVQKQKQPESTTQQLDVLKESLMQRDQFIRQIQHQNKRLSKEKQQIQSNIKVNMLHKMQQARKQVENKSLKQEIEALKKQMEQIKKQNNSQRYRTDEQIHRVKTLNRQLEKQIVQVRKDKNDLLKKKNNIKNQLDRLKQQKISLQANYKVLQEEISILKHKNKEFLKINEQICKMNEQNNKKILQDSFFHHEEQQKVGRLVESINAQNKMLNQKITEYQQQLQEKSKKIQQTEHQNQQLKKKISKQLEQNKKALQLATQQGSETMKHLSETIKTLEQHNQENIQLVRECEKQLNEKDKKIRKLNHEVNELKKILQEKQKQIFSLIQKINHMKYELMDDIDAKSQYIRQMRSSYNFKENVYQEKIQLFTLKLNNLQKQTNQTNSLLYRKQQELNNIQKELLNIKSLYNTKLEQNKELLRQNQKLKEQKQSISKQLQQKTEINQAFIAELQKQHQKEIRTLEKQMKKIEGSIKNQQDFGINKDNQIKRKNQQIEQLKQELLTRQLQFKNVSEKIHLKENQLSKAMIEIDQLNQAIFLTKESMRLSNIQGSLITPGNVLSTINNRITSSIMPKMTLSVPKQQDQLDSIMQRTIQKPSQKQITKDYIKKLRQQINGFLTNKNENFNKSFIKDHDEDLIAELSGLRNDIIKGKYKNQILQQLQVIDHQDLEFVSRLDEQLNQFVQKLQKSDSEDGQQMKNALILYEAKVHQLLQQKEKAQKQFSQMNDFYRRQIKCEKTRADKLTDALTTIQKCIGKLIEILFSKENKVVLLKECFQKIDDVYQELLGASLNDYDKYIKNYVQIKEQQAKKKKWF